MATGKQRPTHVKRVKLSDYKDRKADEGSIEIEGDAGTVFRVPPPELWDDDVMALSQADDNLAVATRLLGGEETYAQFVAEGGSAATLMGIIAEAHGVTVGESAASPRS